MNNNINSVYGQYIQRVFSNWSYSYLVRQEI
jgi:hypothetical protein